LNPNQSRIIIHVIALSRASPRSSAPSSAVSVLFLFPSLPRVRPLARSTRDEVGQCDAIDRSTSSFDTSRAFKSMTIGRWVIDREASARDAIDAIDA